MRPPALRIPFQQLLAIVLAQLLALIAQAWLSRVLVDHGIEPQRAHYLAYLVVPPVLLLTLAPVFREHRHFLSRLFRPGGCRVRIAIAAIALGVALRLAWWAQLVAQVSFGIAVEVDPQAIVGPAFSWACPPLPSLLLGLAVMAAIIPLIEETIHRGLLQSAFVHKGPLPAILLSAVIFALFHPPSSYWFVFLMGILLGVQFWLTRSLWATILTHATYNGLVQLDWRCLHGHWNPSPESLPLVLAGTISLAALAGALVLVIVLLRVQRAGALTAPAPSVTQKNRPPVR